ncbi:bacterial transcriptional activator domain-containing protein, partial [Sphingomonas sp.]|uniref:bacterial transcriptional activator domain-containing protein n=1 Tax=Sphingomonas sp. TaxID=28214 RepID=UPI0025D54ADE
LSPAFDDWLRVERSRLGDERRGMALDAAQDALSEHRWIEAKTIASSLIMLDATDEDAVEIALRAFGASGDLKEAHAIYSRHTNALQHELGLAPAEANAALFASLARSKHVGKSAAGMRIRKHRSAPTASQAPAGRTSSPTQDRNAPTTRRYGLIALSLCAAAAAVLIGGARIGHAPAMAATLPLVEVESLAVPAGDRQAEAISAGLRSSLVQKLAGTETPVQVVDAAAHTGRPAALIVRGNSMSDHGELRANIELVAGASGQVLWAATLDRPASELDQFEEQLSLQVAHELHCAYADGRAPYFTRDLELARLSLSHCDTIGRDMEEAARFDAEITRRAPDFARAWAEYAMDTALVTSNLPPALQPANQRRAEAYAHRAIALDPKQGLAYAALAENLEASAWGDRQRIEARGIDADPTSPELHFRVSDNMASIGRLDDALREAKLSYQYDHLLPGKLFLLAQSEILVGNLGDASDALALTRKYWPGRPWSDGLTFLLGMAGSDPAQALSLVTRGAVRLDPTRSPVVEAFLRWRAAPSEVSNAAAVAAIEYAARRNGPTGEDVRLLATLGKINAAYALAGRMPLAAAGNSSEWFEPDLAHFRADPRFMRLAGRLGLAQIWSKTGLWPDFCMQDDASNCRALVAAVLAGTGSRTGAKA